MSSHLSLTKIGDLKKALRQLGMCLVKRYGGLYCGYETKEYARIINIELNSTNLTKILIADLNKFGFYNMCMKNCIVSLAIDKQ